MEKMEGEGNSHASISGTHPVLSLLVTELRAGKSLHLQSWRVLMACLGVGLVDIFLNLIRSWLGQETKPCAEPAPQLLAQMVNLSLALGRLSGGNMTWLGQPGF